MFVTSLDVQKEFMFRHVSDFIPRVQDNDRRKIWDVSENWATPQNSPFKWENCHKPLDFEGFPEKIRQTQLP